MADEVFAAPRRPASVLMDHFTAMVKSAIEKHAMIPKGATVAVALSGGPDSSALLASLARLRDIMGFSLKACHFNHRFRPSSDEDMTFSIGMAESLGVEIAAEMNTEGRPESALQEEARRLRYNFFGRLLHDGFADLVATGHTLDDSVETSIMWMLRGTGPGGFGGIAPVRGSYIRPLIGIRKKEILAWLKACGISFREDPTNVTDDYLRNRIRRHIIPAMEREAEGAVEAVARLARISRSQEIALDRIAGELFEKVAAGQARRGVTIGVKAVAGMDEAARWAIYREALRRVGLNPSRVSFERIEAVDRLLLSSTLGRQVELPGGYIARLDHAGLTIGGKPRRPEPMKTLFKSPMKIEWDGGALFVTEGAAGEGEVADAGKIPAMAVFRKRRPGDFLRLANLDGRKKLKTFLIDRKTPSGERDFMPILALGQEVLWVPGLYLSLCVAADETARRPVTMRWVK